MATHQPLDARAAIDDHAWPRAFELLSAKDASEGLSPDELELLGYVSWWTGNINACINARERAYAAYMERGEKARAGLVCLLLAEDHFHRLATSVGTGWLNRADRLLSEEKESLEYGWLLRTQAVVAYEVRSEVDLALERAQQAYEVGVRFGDSNLETISLHDQGRVKLAKGEVEEGLALMEEAMVRAVGEELDAMVTGRIYCNMIDTCERLADYRRAYEWDEEARRWCERVGHESGFPGICRVKRAEIMRLRGTWTEAEAEARKACEELGDFLDFAGQGFAEIGEIRMRTGDFSAAEEAFRRARELGHEPEPGLALLRLAEGDGRAAYQLITKALGETRLPLHRARLLPARIEIALATGRTDEVAENAAELQRIADEFRSEALAASAAHIRGSIALDQGRADEAVELFQEGWKLWSKVGLPYEAARSRLSLGLAQRRSGAEELAKLEIEAALAVFKRLGAEPDARRAAALLEGEDPQVTRETKALMFTDIVSSTSLIETIGDDGWMHLVQWHDRMLRSRFDKHGGTESDHAGDGFFVVFPTAPAAIECAIDIQRSLRRHRSEYGFAPEVRIGVHCAEITEVEGRYTGVEVNKTARIAAAAGAGEIVASRQGVSALTDDEAREWRTISAKGISEPVEITTIRWR